MIHRPSQANAFTLVELSIVLVILGLLVGGILSGQALIRAAELRAVSTEYSRYVAAVNTFRDKYFALPGDMTNATAFWGVAHATPATCTTTVGTGTQTCDGNGDGKVYFTGAAGAPTTNEVFRFWQHLANAGLIEGSYNGISTSPSTYFLAAGTANSPKSKLGNNAVWVSEYFPNSLGLYNANFFYYEYTSSFFIGGINGVTWPGTGILTAEESWNIDTKIDDGQPGRGKVTGRVGCTSAATGADYAATYTLTLTTKICFMNFTY